MLEVMVNGCYGKMGQIVCDLIEQNENLVLKCGFDKNITGEFAFPVLTFQFQLLLLLFYNMLFQIMCLL